jgi:hypothetical protein
MTRNTGNTFFNGCQRPMKNSEKMFYQRILIAICVYDLRKKRLLRLFFDAEMQFFKNRNQAVSPEMYF